MPARIRPLLALLLLLAATSATPAQPLARFPTGELTIESAGGPRKFQVELATTPAQLEQGLMFRQSMPPDAGMLFDFKTPSLVSMWMKNTYIPLDMLFIASDGRVVHIARETTPLSEQTITAGRPVRGVIEIAGGEAVRLGIEVGDLVTRRLFPAER